MRRLDDPNKRKAAEAELHQLLSSVKDIGDTASLVTYMMAYIEHKSGTVEDIKSGLINETEIILQTETERIVNGFFDSIQKLENETNVEEGEVNIPSDHSDNDDNEQESRSSDGEEREEGNNSNTDNLSPQSCDVEHLKDETTTSIPNNSSEIDTTNTTTNNQLPANRPRNQSNRRQRRNPPSLPEMFIMLKQIMSADTSPLQKARLNFEMLSKNRIPFCSVKVLNIPADHLNVMSIAKHFKHYGDIIDITIDQNNTAIVKFSTSKAAYAAMRSHSAVFNNRFVIVQPHYYPNDPTTFELITNATTRRIREEKEKEEQEHGDRMQLVLERQQILSQEIITLKNALKTRLDLLNKYGRLALTLLSSQQLSFRTSLNKVMMCVYTDSQQLYELQKTAGKAAKVDDNILNGNDPEEELKALLFGIVAIFKDSFIHDELQTAVTTHLISIIQKQVATIHKTDNQIKRTNVLNTPDFRKRQKSNNSKYEIDNRSQSIFISDLPESCVETDVVYSLTGYFGVKTVKKEGSRAVIEFEKAWQTKKPIQCGLKIGQKMFYPQLMVKQ